jgi:hypothetical protein
MGCRRRSRSAWPWAPSLAVVLAAAGCGGGKPAATTAAAPAPRIPAAVASDLRRQAESVADSLDAGDGCAAQTQARQLVAAVTAAVNRRQIPHALLEPLTSSANDLAARITCTPPVEARPQPEPKPKPEHGPKPKPPKHEHRHHGKKKGH